MGHQDMALTNVAAAAVFSAFPGNDTARQQRASGVKTLSPPCATKALRWAHCCATSSVLPLAPALGPVFPRGFLAAAGALKVPILPSRRSLLTNVETGDEVCGATNAGAANAARAKPKTRRASAEPEMTFGVTR